MERIHQNLPSEDFVTNHFDVDNEGNFYTMYATFMGDRSKEAKNCVDAISEKFYKLAAAKISKDSKVSYLNVFFLFISTKLCVMCSFRQSAT